MKKLSTHITGLDKIFLGGIQIDCLTSNVKPDQEESIVIVIRGESGTNKHLLAMQLMHGLSKSIYEKGKSENKDNASCYSKPSRYYSINKPSDRLNDMYLDLLIARWIDAMTHALKREYLLGLDSGKVVNQKEESVQTMKKTEPDNLNNTNGNDDTKSLAATREEVLKFWFKNSIEDDDAFKKRLEELGITPDSVTSLLTNNILSYNPRTNSIHYRRISQGDSDVNILYKRRYDSIYAYTANYAYTNKPLYIPKEYSEQLVGYNFDSELVNVEFNPHLNRISDNSNDDSLQDESGGGVVIDRNSKKALLSFFNILQNIEDGLEPKESDYGQVNKQPDGTLPYEVVVIDGFSHLDDTALKSLPYGHLRKTLHKYARIAILVFDDRKTVDCDGDIVIDLRKNIDVSEEYSYFELQVAKSVFQPYAFGWHQYKRREEGLTIFPSTHLLLTRRFYIANRIHDIGFGIFENTFSEYIESAKNKDIISTDFSSKESVEKLHNKFYLKQYNESQENIIDSFLTHIECNLTESINESDKKIGKLNIATPDPYSYLQMNLLDELIFGPDNLTNEDGPDAWSSHYPTTAIIGNPNSFKRMLILSKAYHWAKKREHVLFVLFGKNPQDMRKHMICPGIMSKLFTDQSEGCGYNEICKECSKYIHFLGIRSGCISAEEFFHTLIEQIEIYCDRDAKYGFEKRRLHIIIDDFQRIDFSFPFIKNTSLFTCSLIEICRMHNVELSILCDKSSERRKEVCALADNVLCIERDEDDLTKFRLFVERMSNMPFPSALLKYEISDAYSLFKCTQRDGLIINADSVKSSRFIGSMKEYWRKTENVVQQKDGNLKNGD